MKVRSILWAASMAATISFAGDGHAGALAGHSSVNVNIRSGPGVRFPVAGLAVGGSSMMIHGCVSRYTWCDVSMGGVRGWVSGAHLQFAYENRWVYVPAYAAQVEIPIVSFHLAEYWNDYYHDREFYADLAHWDSYHWEDDGLPPGWRDNWEDDDDDHEY